MRIEKLNDSGPKPAVSLVLVDWSVRESFHIIDYLKKQTVARERFEIVIVEFYDRISPALEPHADEIDSWILLQAPESCYYHKHLMYNAGILAARGDIVMIGDSDAMVRETFIETIIDSFAAEPEIVLHLDQYRNNRRDLYPFAYPSFEDILGPGCVNDAGGATAGVRDRLDPLHSRNYGACMSARRDDLVRIGGADEHVDFVGHICGPYDLTFRLINDGRREVWHDREFTFHSWHPGAAGVDNYQGPHDGRQMSSTSLDALISGRTAPLRENPAIAALREGRESDRRALLARLVSPEDFRGWHEERLIERTAGAEAGRERLARLPARHLGHVLDDAGDGRITVAPLTDPARAETVADLDAALALVERRAGTAPRLLSRLGGLYLLAERIWDKLLRETLTRRAGAR